MVKDYRKIMEKHIGRRLKRSEIVHHIDGDNYNNDISNLTIVTASEHRKQKHSKYAVVVDAELKKLSEDLEVKHYKDALDTLFTQKQQDILIKRLHGERLSKTDTEIYSRVIKKRLKAIANRTLSRIASILVIR